MRRIGITVTLPSPSLCVVASALAAPPAARVDQGRQAQPRRAMHAARGLRRSDPGLAEDAGRQGRDASPSRTAPPATRHARLQAGLKADVVAALDSRPDIDLLVKAGLVDAKWNRQSYKGIATNSVVVFAVRDGNPKKIKNWDDLLKPGVGIVTPNPFIVRCGEVERDGRVRRSAPSSGRRTSRRSRASSACSGTSSVGQVGPQRHQHVPRGQGDVCSRTRTRRASRSSSTSSRARRF